MVRSLYSPAQLAEVRACQQCGVSLVRQPKESPSAFMTRIFCDRACSNRWANAQRRGIPNPNLQGERNGMFGRVRTSEERDRIRRKLLGHKLTPEQTARKVAAQTGSRRGADTKKKMAESRSRWWQNATPEQRDQHSRKVRQSGAALRSFHSEHFRQWHANLTPAQRLARNERIRTATLAAHHKFAHNFRRTSIERKIASVLDELGVCYEWNVALLGRFCVDFLLTDYPLVIECDGDYWHSLPLQQRRDAAKNEAIPAAGYCLLRLTETAINTDLVGCVQRIVDTLREVGSLTLTQPGV